MTEQFATIELAGLYESQGYIDDALAMYNTLVQEDGPEEIRQEAREALERLAKAAAAREEKEAGESRFSEQSVSKLLEEWLMLMVVEKRVNVFKTIKARL